MTEITSRQLEALIQQSQFAKDEFDYSFEAQKKLAFEIAVKLVVEGENVDDAIDIAKNLVDRFYHKAVKRGAWERS